MEIQVGVAIHILSSNADDPLLCVAAIPGGKMGGNWWVLALPFAGAHVSWLTDHSAHAINDCTTGSGQAETYEVVGK